MKTITATFTGTNGSLGYITGKNYTLTLKQMIKSQKLWITRQDNGGGDCEYSNTITFLENWTNIKVIK